MATIVTRIVKGSALTFAEGDANFNNLNNDKLENISEDTTPQLGGNLDVNGNAIVGTSVAINASNGDLMISATEDGPVVLRYDNNLKLTTKSDGVDITGELQADSLDIDGNADISGTLNTHTIPGGTGTFALTSQLGIQNVVEDTTPQLGGDLDLNSNDVTGTGDVNITGTVVAQSTLNAQTGTTYTTVLGDASKLVTLSNAAAITLTIPTNASVAYAVGTKIDFAQIGAGQVTVAGAGGVTVNATPGLKFRAQYSAATCIKTATDTWLLVGDLSA